MTDAARMPIGSGSGPDRSEEEIGRLAAALGDPTRRKVFFAVRHAGRALSKDEVAAEVGIDRRLAGHHLDKLVDHGFLEAEFHRRNGRTGPGAGRPAKHYLLAHVEETVPLPERHYDVLASLLLRAAADDSGDSRQTVLERVGYEFGFQVGLAEAASGGSRPGPTGVDAVTEVVRLLSRYGFAAESQGHGTIRACSCPFEELALADPDRVCGLDRSIWRGMLAAFDDRATLSVGATRARGNEACVAEVAPAAE